MRRWEKALRSARGGTFSLVTGIATVAALGSWIFFAALAVLLSLTIYLTMCFYLAWLCTLEFMGARGPSSRYQGASREGGKSDLTFQALADFWGGPSAKKSRQKESDS